ncbi:MAG: hypothetical protein OXI38_08585 [Bacteroidota bacterium]|nr:hypothetical protein [Bacteroidota bacterium]
MPAEPDKSFSRRQFLQLSLVAAAAACSDLGLEEESPLFDGPVIDEQEFIALNANYYGTGLDPVTRLPYRELRGNTLVRETDPIAIAFRLQHLLAHAGNRDVVDTMLTHLLEAQISDRPPRNYRNMLPRMSVDSGRLAPATLEYSFTDNAVLSARVAMAAQLFSGTSTGDKALTFLEKQKLGYNQALAQSSGFMPTFAHAGLFGVDPMGINLLFGGYYASVAFVLAYFIGGTPMIADPQAGLNSWQSMIAAQNALVNAHPASTTGSHTIQTPLARNGSAYQYFHSLLAVDPVDLTDSMRNGLYNVLYSYLDAAVYDRVPGIYSAGPHGGGFLLDNGLNRLAARQRQQSSQETIVTVDALATALRMFPEDSDERLILRGWIGLYATVGGATGTQGFYGGLDREGNPVEAIYARQNGAMILFDSTGAQLLSAFLVAQGKPSMRELIGQIELRWQEGSLPRIDDQLPFPIRQERLFTSPPGS